MLPLLAIAVFGQGPSTLLTSLPPAMAMPSPSLDASAEILAEKVARHEPDAGPALMAALRASGFTVLVRGGKHLQEPAEGKGMGLGVEDSEILDVLNAGPDGPSFAFKTLSDAYAGLGKASPETVHQALIESLQKAMSSPIPEVRFFAQFVDDLSANGPGGWSLRATDQGAGALGGVDAAAVAQAGTNGTTGWFTQQMAEITPKLSQGRPSPETIERMSVIQKAIEGMNAAGPATSALRPDGTLETRPFADEPISALQALLLSRRIYGDLYARFQAKKALHERQYVLVGEPQNPLAGYDYSGTIVDGSALLVTTTFNEGVYKQIEDAEGNATGEEFAGKFGNLSTVGAFSKLFAAYCMLDMKLDPAPIELVRRKDEQPGTTKPLTFTIQIHNKAAKANVPLRSLGWGLTADISMPDDGPIHNAEVNWRLVQPGAVLDSFVQYVSPGQAGDGAIKTTARTDKQGQAKIGIQTTPQPFELPANAVSYPRKSQVMVEATLKGANLYQDVVDAIGVVMAAKDGGAAGIVKAGLADMISRTTLLSTKFWPVDVKDWTMPAYEGTFTATLEGSARSGDGHVGAEWHVHRTVKGRIVSALQEMPKAEMLLTHGTGPYYFTIDHIGDAVIDDSADQRGESGGGCQEDAKPWSVHETSAGPVVQYGAGYKLNGGSLIVTVVHENGRDVRKVLAQGGFVLPVRVHREEHGTLFKDSRDPHAPTDWIDYAPIPLPFEDQPAGGQLSEVIRGSGEEDLPFNVLGLEGKVHVHATYELHKATAH